MLRKCESCGDEYAARSARSRFCSDRCRVRHSRGAVPSPGSAGDNDPLVAAVIRELTAAGKLDSMRGQQALILARRMAGGDTTAGIAALSRELRSVVAAATGTSGAGANAPADGIDELRARRDAKRRTEA